MLGENASNKYNECLLCKYLKSQSNKAQRKMAHYRNPDLKFAFYKEAEKQEEKKEDVIPLGSAVTSSL